MKWQWQTFLRTLKWIVWSQFKCSNTYFSIFALFQELFIPWQDEFKYSFYPFWNVVHSKTVRCNFEYIGLIVSWWKFKSCHDHSILNNMHAWNISYEYIEYIWQIQCQSYSCSESNKSLQPVHLITVYPKKYAHGFAVLCFVVVMQSFIMNSHEVFIHIYQGCFAGTGAIVRLPQCQWSKPDGYG